MTPVSGTILAACRRISDEATAMSEKARWSGMRPGNQIMAGRRGIAEGIVADYLSAFASSVAKGEAPETAYQRVSEELRAAINRFNAGIEWQVQRDKDCGQDTLRWAFWEVEKAAETILGWHNHAYGGKYHAFTNRQYSLCGRWHLPIQQRSSAWDGPPAENNPYRCRECYQIYRMTGEIK